MKSITPFQPKPGLKPTVRRIAALDDAPPSSFPFERDSELTFKGDSPVVGELLMLLLESMRQFRAQSGSTNISVAGNTTVIRQNICNIVNNYRAAVSGNMSTELRALLTDIEGSFSGGNITSEQTEQLINGLSVQLSRIAGVNQRHTADVSELTSILGGNTRTDVSGIIRELKKNAEMTRLRELRSFTARTDRLFSSAAALEFREEEHSVSLRELLRESSAAEREIRRREFSTERHFREYSSEHTLHTDVRDVRTERSDSSRTITEQRKNTSAVRNIRRENSHETRSESTEFLSGFLRSAGGRIILTHAFLDEKRTSFAAVSDSLERVLTSAQSMKSGLTRELTDREHFTVFSRESTGSRSWSLETRLMESAGAPVPASEAALRLMHSVTRAENSRFTAQIMLEHRSLLTEKSRELSAELRRERTRTRENAVRLCSEMTFLNTEREPFVQPEPIPGRPGEAPVSAVFRQRERLSVNLSTELRRAEILRELRKSAVSERRLAELRREISAGKSGFGNSGFANFSFRNSYFGNSGAGYMKITGQRAEILSEMRAAANSSHSAERTAEFLTSERNNELIYSTEYRKDTSSATEKLLREGESTEILPAGTHLLRNSGAPGVGTPLAAGDSPADSVRNSHGDAASHETPAAGAGRVFREIHGDYAHEVPAKAAMELLNVNSFNTFGNFMRKNYDLYIELPVNRKTISRGIFREHAAGAADIREMLTYLYRETAENTEHKSEKVVSEHRSESNISEKYTFGNRENTVRSERNTLTGGERSVPPLSLNSISRLLSSRNRTVERLYSAENAVIRLVEAGAPSAGTVSLPGGVTALFGLSELVYAGTPEQRAAAPELRGAGTVQIGSGTGKAGLVRSAVQVRGGSGADGKNGADGISAGGAVGSSANGMNGAGADGRPGSDGRTGVFRSILHDSWLRRRMPRELLRKIVVSSEHARLYGGRTERRFSMERTAESCKLYFGSVSSAEFYSGESSFAERIFRAESSEKTDTLREIFRSELVSGLTEKYGFTESRRQTETRRTAERFTSGESTELIVQALGGSSAEILENGGLVLAAVPARSGASENSAAAGLPQEEPPAEDGTPAHGAAPQDSEAVQDRPGSITEESVKELRELVRSTMHEVSQERRFTEKIQSTVMSRENADRLCGMVMERLESRLRTESRITGR